MVVYVVVTSLLRNVAFLIYALFGEISILEIPVVGNFFTFCRSAGFIFQTSSPYDQLMDWKVRPGQLCQPNLLHFSRVSKEKGAWYLNYHYETGRI